MVIWMHSLHCGVLAELGCAVDAAVARSQNHILVRAGRHVWRSFRQGLIEQVTQDSEPSHSMQTWNHLIAHLQCLAIHCPVQSKCRRGQIQDTGSWAAR